MSCAAPNAIHYANSYANSPNVIASNAEYLASLGITPQEGPRSVPIRPAPTPPQRSGPSVGETIGAIVALPFIITLAMLANYSAYAYGSSHCYTYTYKDQYHAKCY
jgi:hypothetical protein